MVNIRMAFFGGAGAAIASLGAIVLLSRLEGQRAVRPVNATSHVIWGADAGAEDEIDARHSLPGFVINIASAFFWGTVFACALPGRNERSRKTIVIRALATSLAAGILDYGLVPRRLRPGWELALKGRSVTLAIAAMGLGIAGGGIVADAPGKQKRLSNS